MGLFLSWACRCRQRWVCASLGRERQRGCMMAQPSIYRMPSKRCEIVPERGEACLVAPDTTGHSTRDLWRATPCLAAMSVTWTMSVTWSLA